MNALLLALTVSWQCHARPLIGLDNFLGIAPTRSAAVDVAMQACYAHGHVGCYIQYCELRP